MENYPLFTVGMLAYKNYRFIKDALESVFIQNYPNIELIVSNDGSDDFDEADLIAYLSEKRTGSIVKIQINNNEKNLGTCRHVNKVIGMASGSYIMFMAADDAFFDENSITNIVKTFIDNNEPLAVCGNSGMYDLELKECYETVPSLDVKQKLQTLSPNDLYRALATQMFVPTAATTYNMKAFETLGLFDERIFLVEDWPFFLKMTRSGYKPYYRDVMISKHRDGGICHGNNSGVTNAFKNYYSDEIKAMEIELMPFKRELGVKLFGELRSKYQYLKALYTIKYQARESTGWTKFSYLLKASPYLCIKILKRGGKAFVDACLTKFGQPYFILITLALAAIYSFVDFEPIIGTVIFHYLNTCIGILALVFVLLFVVGILARLLRYLAWPIQKIRSLRDL